jgi:hypothetical protein
MGILIIRIVTIQGHVVLYHHHLLEDTHMYNKG